MPPAEINHLIRPLYRGHLSTHFVRSVSLAIVARQRLRLPCSVSRHAVVSLHPPPAALASAPMGKVDSVRRTDEVTLSYLQIRSDPARDLFRNTPSGVFHIARDISHAQRISRASAHFTVDRGPPFHGPRSTLPPSHGPRSTPSPIAPGSIARFRLTIIQNSSLRYRKKERKRKKCTIWNKIGRKRP